MRFKQWLLQQENAIKPVGIPMGPQMPGRFNTKPTQSAKAANDLVTTAMRTDQNMAGKMADLSNKPNGQQDRDANTLASKVLAGAGHSASKSTTPADVTHAIRSTAAAGEGTL